MLNHSLNESISPQYLILVDHNWLQININIATDKALVILKTSDARYRLFDLYVEIFSPLKRLAH